MSRNELYGYLHPATREWREGIISVTFRDMANNKTNKHQWIVLDGDIDAEWIEVSPLPLSGGIVTLFSLCSFAAQVLQKVCMEGRDQRCISEARRSW